MMLSLSHKWILSEPVQNSERACLQTPHGIHGDEKSPPFPPAIAMSVKLRFPSLTALNSAVRSAQQVTEYEAFSILHPVYKVPSSASNAAPTQNPEYGEYAPRAASFAFDMS